jgi:HAD superfamily hydrolase (TIGR01509 family)
VSASAIAFALISAKYVNRTSCRDAVVAYSEMETVILDMDGTLLDLHFDREVWNRLLPERLATVLQCSVETAKREVEKRLGAVKGTLAWYSLDHWSEQLGIDVHALELELKHLIRPRPGAMEFLKALQSSAYRVVLATNAQPSSMRRKLDITGIEQYFDDISCSHYFGNCKEDPAFWSAFIKELSIAPTTALLIDDNHTVLETAQEFGIAEVYGIRYPSTRGPAMTSVKFRCIDSFSELDLIQQAN